MSLGLSESCGRLPSRGLLAATLALLSGGLQLPVSFDANFVLSSRAYPSV
jgi:hypothetical protein